MSRFDYKRVRKGQYCIIDKEDSDMMTTFGHADGLEYAMSLDSDVAYIVILLNQLNERVNALESGNEIELHFEDAQ